MFTSEQRSHLNQLSKMLYGSESKWQKELDKGNFRIPTETIEVKETIDTVQFKARRGQIMGRLKAIALGLVKEDQVPTERTIKKQQYRDPTYEDMIKAFELMIDHQRIGRMPKQEVIQVLAYRYVKSTLEFKLSLVKGDADGYDKDLAELMQTVPEARREEIQALVVTEEKPADGLPLDAIQFISDFVFALNHEDEAKALADDSLQAVDVSPPKSKVPVQYLETMSMKNNAAPIGAEERARRRAKTKASRLARRKQRSA